MNSIYKIHYLYEDKLIIMLLSEQANDTKAFAYLDEIKEKIERYLPDQFPNRNSFQLEEGKKKVQMLMNFYNSCLFTTTKGEIIDNLNSAEDAVIENIETLIEGNNKIDIICQKKAIKET